MSSHDYRNKPHPDVTEVDKAKLKDAIKENGQPYFRSKDMDIPEWTKARIGWVCGKAGFVEQWNDGNIAIWKVVE